MLPDLDKIKMAKAADECYKKKYSKLTEAYLKKPAAHANLDDIINGTVSMEHGDAITNYSGGLSGAVNWALRGDYIDLTTEIQAYESSLRIALESLPSFNNHIVYRMELHVEDTAPYEAYFKRNLTKILSVPCYLSTSKEDWNWEKVVFIIKTLKENSRARDISRITNKKDETEVLFLRNTNFLIKITKNEERLMVFMEETEEDADAVLNHHQNSGSSDDKEDDQEPGLFD